MRHRRSDCSRIFASHPPSCTALADELGAGLIVMGTHGRKGLTHALMGSIAEKVVRTSKVPVLVAPPKK